MPSLPNWCGFSYPHFGPPSCPAIDVLWYLLPLKVDFSLSQHLNLSYTAGGNVKRCSHFVKSLAVPQNVKPRVTISPGSSTPVYIPKGNDIFIQNTYTNVPLLFIISKKGNSTHVHQLMINKIQSSSIPLHVVSLSAVTIIHGQPWSENIENFRNKIFLGFKLCAILNSMIKSRAILSGIWIIRLCSVTVLYLLPTH